MLETLNQTLFLMVNPAQPSQLTLSVATFFANWLLDFTPLLLAGLWLWEGRRTRFAVLAAGLSMALGLALNQLIGLIYFHPRPFMMGIGHAYVAHVPEASLPSDHGTWMFSMALALFVHAQRRAAAAVVLAAVLVTWARIYVGLHVPFDFVGSFLVAGCSTLLVACLLPRWYGERLLIWQESLYRRFFGFVAITSLV